MSRLPIEPSIKVAGGAERKGAWLGRLAGYPEGSRDDDHHHPLAPGIESFTTTTINSVKLVHTIIRYYHHQYNLHDYYRTYVDKKAHQA